MEYRGAVTMVIDAEAR